MYGVRLFLQVRPTTARHTGARSPHEMSHCWHGSRGLALSKQKRQETRRGRTPECFLPVYMRDSSRIYASHPVLNFPTLSVGVRVGVRVGVSMHVGVVLEEVL